MPHLCYGVGAVSTSGGIKVSRPLKQGIDYFPLDVVLDTKMQLIEAEFGLEGFALVVKLLQKIYGEQGYYCEWTDEVTLLFASKNGKGVNVVSELIKGCLRRGIFDEGMYKTYGILTSRGIQKRYREAKRGDISKIRPEYLLLSVPKNEVNATKTGVNATKTGVNVATSTQSKEEKRRVEKSRVNKTIAEAYRKSFGELNGKDEVVLCGWTDQGIDERLIIEAFNIAISRGKGFNYAVGIVNKWLVEGKTVQPKRAVQTTKFVNYNQPEYTDEEIEAAIARKKARRCGDG